jgi:hypothetical protein
VPQDGGKAKLQGTSSITGQTHRPAELVSPSGLQ